MSEVHTETTQFDVNLPKPRGHKVLLGVLAAIAVVAVVAVAAAVILNRTAQGQGEATARVMPAETMLYFSMNPHTEQLPNYNVIADAWRDSKEARQVSSALELAVTQAGLNWSEDIAPWLGERVAFGLIDLGSADQTGGSSYHAPAFALAIQTRNRTASDKALASVRGTLEKNLNANRYYTPTIGDDTYRGIPLVYMTTESSIASPGTNETRTQENLAYATVNDVIVVSQNRASLQKAIDAALDGKSLVTSQNYQTVMNALPNQNAGALYMDYSRFMPAYFDMMMGVQESMGNIYGNITDDLVCRNSLGTPDPQCVQQKQAEAQRQRDEARQQLEAQLQQMRDALQSMGGVGAVMTYEPTGIRFDTAAQQDVSKLPETWRKLYESLQKPAPNRIFGSLPADTIMVGSVGLNNQVWDFLFDPDYQKLMLSGLPSAERDQVLSKLSEFQKLIGVDLKTDFFQLLKGEAAFAVLPRAVEKQDSSWNDLPLQFAALFDSSDAAKAASSLDKIFQGLSAMGTDGPKWQSLSGQPYSVVSTSKGAPVLTYGVVDGRLVIGTNSNTLLAIGNAGQAPLANSDVFKQATGPLSGNRIGTFYMNFQPFWTLFGQASSDQTCQPCNYLQKFKWLSADTAAPANGLSRGSLHIGVGQ